MSWKQPLWRIAFVLCLFLLWSITPPVHGQETDTHVVQPGETLSQIAQQYEIPLVTLMRANGLTNADAIYVGQVLTLPLEEAAPGATVHLVQAGETLSQIAQQYGVSVAALMAANNLASAGEIYWGQTLRIPSADEASSLSGSPQQPTAGPTEEPSPTLTPKATLDSADSQEHRVQAGETASEIAKRYGVRLADLLAANGIANADRIFVGQTLVIPASTTAEDTTAVESVSRTLSEVELETSPADAPPSQESPAIPPLSEHPHASLNPTYIVRSGDTLSLIALRLGVDRDALLQLNNLTNASRLTAGQRLLLPATEKELVVESPSQQYIVRPGDSLSAIARDNGLTLADLMSANRISNPDAISVGQRLVIPGRNASDNREGVQVGPARSGYFYYTVRRGDTLSELARALESTKLALMEYNDLPDESTVFAGMELRVPYGPPPLPVRRPPTPLSGTSFLVSLSRQQCWVFQGERVLYQWTCSTGYGEWRTRTGAFAVQSKIENAKSNAYRLDMPYWLGIYDVGRYENGIHGLPVEWDTGQKIWTRLIGQPATFGCAMLDDADAKTLFDLAYIGMPVYIVQ